MLEFPTEDAGSREDLLQRRRDIEDQLKAQCDQELVAEIRAALAGNLGEAALGIVTRIDTERGFGFIDDGIFFHANEIGHSLFASLAVGSKIDYDWEWAEHRGKSQRRAVRVVLRGPAS